MSDRVKFFLIFLLTAIAVVLAYPREDQLFQKIGLKDKALKIQQGLDLQGGAYLVYEADLSKAPRGDQQQALQSLVQVIERRVNPGGTSEVVVQTSGTNRVIVQLPGVEDINQAIELIGKTAQLNFVEITATPDGQQAQLPTDVSGNDVSRANVDIDPQTGTPVVSLQLKGGESTKKFADLTTRLSQSGSRLLNTLDDQVVFGPATVQGPITDGRAQLSGNFTIDQAREVAQLLNAGALPVPITLVEQRTVGATLGQESVSKSFLAGVIGLMMVAIFMLLYYRVAGLMAVLALATYTLLTLSVFKLSALTPYTFVLTLAGVAGFILSIGMAVDANILIFERFKEELRSGKSLIAALEAGFDRAWTSIRDSNVSTLITCTILYTFSSGAPIIRGFAATLALGVIMSMFTAIVVTRTFMRLLVRTKYGQKVALYGANLKRNVT